MIGEFINIRFKQVYREIKGIGLFRVIFLAGLLVFLGFILFKQTEILPNVYYFSGIYLSVIVLIQLIRHDKLFLKSHFNNYKLICLTEYSILTIPLLLCLIYHSHWLLIFISFLSLFLIANLDFKVKPRDLNTKIQQCIPYDCFEWKGGLRKFFLFIVPLWIISLTTSFFIGSVPIAIFILGLVPFGFYEKSEPYQMILAYEMSTRRFLFHKISLQIILFSVITIPLVLTFMFFHYEHWYIPIVEYIIFISLHIYFILAKYAFYEPNSKSPITVIFGSIGATAIFIPFLLPVVWLLSVWFYIKSTNKLNLYLNDYN
ncbi:hypothetical protein ACXR6G_07450 [Ancylomarina sp. YFZ004]